MTEQRTFRRGTSVPDRLPPNSMEAEQGVLGCVLIAPPECFPVVEERFKGERVFYDLRHQEIWDAMASLQREGKSIDVITVQQVLKDREKIEQVGGVTYLTALLDIVPSAANLPTYLDIVWEKFLARQLVHMSTDISLSVMDVGGVTEPLLERVKRLQSEFEAKSQRGTLTPRYLKPATDFAEDAFNCFFGEGDDTQPGYDLPIGFPLKIRRGETTLLSGDDGSGKSTLLSYFGLHLLNQGPEKMVVASLEMPPRISLWIMAAQLIGAKRLPDCHASRVKLGQAVAWLSKRVVFYDFLGIADWRDILDTFRYAATRMGGTIFTLDSVMRIGIPDDDYSMQGLAAAHFAQFAKDTRSHLFFVVHENKGDGKGKTRVRGSKLWTANADNVLQIEINSEKETKAGKTRCKLDEEKRKKNPNQEVIAQCNEDLQAQMNQWDSHLVLRKQRYPGSRQNASHFMWFNSQCFQFRDKWPEPPVNWLDRWNKKERTE